MTARVIQDVAADVQAVIEAEDRPSLDRFNNDLLASRYGHVMLIDGNDPRHRRGHHDHHPGRDRVHAQQRRHPGCGRAREHLFSRNCAQYQCRLPSGVTVWVLLNHFKSQSDADGPKRARQAAGVRDIVDGLVAAGQRHLVVMGDLNEGPAAAGQPPANLAPLLDPDSPLVAVYSLPVLDPGPRPGTFQSCGIGNRLDYIFVSRDLAALVVGRGIERHGLWGGPTNVNPPSQ